MPGADRYAVRRRRSVQAGRRQGVLAPADAVESPLPSMKDTVKVGDTLRVLDMATGKELWAYSYDAPGSFMVAGSRMMPTVDGEYVYTVGPMGDLHAISTKTRKPAWRKAGRSQSPPRGTPPSARAASPSDFSPRAA
jgi:PQQ-like domain